MPICSITSPVCCLIPAVSINLYNTPSIFNSSSTVSLVVPGISLTKALCSFNKVFNKVDFPALGLPTMATCTPFFITFPNLKDSSKIFVLNCNCCTKISNSFLFAKATSSCEKSNSNSIKAENLISFSRINFKSSENPPFKLYKAA